MSIIDFSTIVPSDAVAANIVGGLIALAVIWSMVYVARWSVTKIASYFDDHGVRGDSSAAWEAHVANQERNERQAREDVEWKAKHGNKSVYEVYHDSNGKYIGP
ncbi:hypothetical protein [Collimonas antrihumi]|uniref:hypothetical protein n=1 Tax=Collimonas antrihumi TaxID=1940615 RepID=UPI001B8AB407|nr:hypothetical protein [Collimonas antrihumi]